MFSPAMPSPVAAVYDRRTALTERRYNYLVAMRKYDPRWLIVFIAKLLLW